MFFTWKDMIVIIMKMFAWKPRDIAEHLDVHKSTISRHLKEESKNFTLSREEIYKIIFDLDNPGSAVYKLNTTERYLLQSLQETIEEVKLRNVMNGLWVENFNQYKKGHYKEFVTTMLERTRSNSAPYESVCPSESVLVITPSLCHALPPKPVLFGRRDELQKIADTFAVCNYTLLTGIGGMGKSHLALAYAHRLVENDGVTVRHVDCKDTDSLQSAIGQLQFDGLSDNDELNLKQKMKVLTAYKQPALIIMDNLEQPFSQTDQEVFDKLTKCQHIQLLITSESALVPDKRKMVNVGPLDEDALFELYSYHRFSDPDNHQAYIDERKEVLKQIFAKVGSHTLMIELLAKLPIMNGLDETDVYNYLNNDIDIPLVHVEMDKGGISVEDSIKNIMVQIFAISKLNNQEKQIMRCMSLIPHGGIKFNMFEELTGHAKKEIIKLVNKNWIILDEELFRLRMHPLICNAIFDMDETRPSYETCKVFFSNIQSRMDLLGPQSRQWQYLNRIKANALWKNVWHPIRTSPLIPLLKDEYQSALFLLNKQLKEYIDEG